MKRFILSLTAAAVLSMPMAASALEKMDNNQLKSSTGQAGVSIAVDDVVIYQKSLADVTYWDTDGMTVSTGYQGTDDPSLLTTTQGSVAKAGIMIDHDGNTSKLITIDAILDNNEYGIDDMRTDFGDAWADLHGDDKSNMDIGIVAQGVVKSTFANDGDPDATLADPMNGSVDGFTNGISPLSIDVGTCEALSEGLQWNTDGSDEVAGVIIGLPTVEITTYNSHNVKDIKLVTGGDFGTDHDAVNQGASFIQIEKTGASQMAILGGTLEIAPH